MRMAEIQCRNDLPEKLSRLLRRKSSLFHQIVEKFTAGNVFQHQIQVLLVLVHIGQAEHVRMVDQLHDGDFALHLLAHTHTGVNDINCKSLRAVNDTL